MQVVWACQTPQHGIHLAFSWSHARQLPLIRRSSDALLAAVTIKHEDNQGASLEGP
jgi:hypothetical protein